MEGKRSLDIPASEIQIAAAAAAAKAAKKEEEMVMVGDKPTTSSTHHDNTIRAKKKKPKTLTESSNAFRAWSHPIHDSSNTNTTTCTIYTLKCTFGDASKPLNSYIKRNKVPFLKNELERRGLSSVGSKSVLLQRLQKELPFVTLDIDSRECLQRLVNSMLFHFKWDNTHLFECEMPRRGELKDGVGKLWETLGSLDMALAIKMGYIHSDPSKNEPCLRKRLDQLGITCEMIATIQNDPDTLGNVRKLVGSAFDPMNGGIGGYELDYDFSANGSQISLEQLALQKHDQIKMLYDYGDQNTFVVEVLDVKKNVPLLPEVNHYGHDTRVKMVGKGQCKMRKQYDDGSNKMYMNI